MEEVEQFCIRLSIEILLVCFIYHRDIVDSFPEFFMTDAGARLYFVTNMIWKLFSVLRGQSWPVSARSGEHKLSIMQKWVWFENLRQCAMCCEQTVIDIVVNSCNLFLKTSWNKLTAMRVFVNIQLTKSIILSKQVWWKNYWLIINFRDKEHFLRLHQSKFKKLEVLCNAISEIKCSSRQRWNCLSALRALNQCCSKMNFLALCIGPESETWFRWISAAQLSSYFYRTCLLFKENHLACEYTKDEPFFSDASKIYSKHRTLFFFLLWWMSTALLKVDWSLGKNLTFLHP